MINLYGKLTNGISQARLTFPYPSGSHEIAGTVAYNPTDDTQLLFTPFAPTLPANTLIASIISGISPRGTVDAIIDPYNVTVDSDILSPSVGTRYLILNPIGSVASESAIAWAGSEIGNNLIARANDIIEWTGTYWYVVFDSREPTTQYVSNINTTVQYRWTGSE